MLTPSPNDTSDSKSLAVARTPIEVVLIEGGASPLSLVLPPYEDIREIETLRDSHFSIREWSQTALAHLWEPLKFEYERLSRKQALLGNQYILLNRLANLTAIGGDLVGEEHYLREALKLRDSEPVRIRLVENLIAAHKDRDASALLGKEDLSKSVYANLRIASSLAVKGLIDEAAKHVATAVSIDPLDFGARLFEGSLKLWKGDNEAALLSFRIALERKRNSAALYTNMAVGYLRLNRLEKASQCLRRAVAIEPLNVNSVTFLADLAFAQGRDEDAIPALRYLIRFEQKNAGAWGRLARGLLRIGEIPEAVAAIKRQASIENTNEVWNNLGVAYLASGDRKKSLESFKHAMEISEDSSERGFCVAAKNLAAMITKSGSPADVLKFILATIAPANKQSFLSDNVAGSIFIIQLHSLISLHQTEKAVTLAEDLLSDERTHPQLACRLATGLLAIYSLNEGWSDHALSLAARFKPIALSYNFNDDSTRAQLLNNIAFCYAEFGNLAEAEECLRHISDGIHVNPYITATSGLLHLKKGHLDRADVLYQEALRLCVAQEDKARIRQKWNLEIGKTHLIDSPASALRSLFRARDEKGGEDGLVRQATRLIHRLKPR